MATTPELTRSPELVAAPAGRVRLARRALGAALGALIVALAAQVVVPVPIGPVPMTLQPLAVLAVGGVLGATGGTSALVLYLLMGLAGLPVFAGGAGGPLWLAGPTGGYLLAFPLAAAIVGALVERGRPQGASPAVSVRMIGWTLAGCALGMVVIHVGGVARLALLGDAARAFRMGFVPFLTGDLLKVGLAAAVILVARPLGRSLR